MFLSLRELFLALCGIFFFLQFIISLMRTQDSMWPVEFSFGCFESCGMGESQGRVSSGYMHWLIGDAAEGEIAKEVYKVGR